MIPNISEQPEKFGEVIFSTVMPSSIMHKNDILDQVMASINKVGLLDDEMGIRLALDEALSNSIIHGNKRDPDKNVKVELFFENNRWGIIFEDEGEGFIPKEIPDFNDPETLFAEGGRGLFLMHHYMDKVSYCGRGNIIQLEYSVKQKPIEKKTSVKKPKDKMKVKVKTKTEKKATVKKTEKKTKAKKK